VYLVVAALGLYVGWVYYSPSAAGDRGGSSPESVSYFVILGQIVSQNAGAVLLAFSGVLTFGITTALSTVLTSSWVGATAHAVVAQLGIWAVAGRVWPYVCLEFGAIAVASTAGLYPASGTLTGLLRRSSPTKYWQRLRTSLGMLVVALALVLLGAGIESALVVRGES
jgi:uncharacterized membrane protein SpoIIM required for sporulation